MTVGRRTAATALSLAVLLAPIAACGGDDDGATTTTAGPDSGSSSSSSSSTSSTGAADPLVIVVTNDDGIGSDGIDVLVQHLSEIDGAEIHVVAPKDDNSGASDTTTPPAPGPTYDDGSTQSGVEGTAVDGFPADTIAIAVDELGLEPDIVVSGINIGQNIGPFVPLSGTIGAARAAARRGIPALAVSAELQEPDYETAAELAVEWIEDHLDVLGNGANDGETVASINVPTCAAGTEVRGVIAVPVAAAFPEGETGLDIAADCASTIADPADDYTAMLNGYASESEVPADL